MPYAHEQSGLRRELARNTTGTFSFWPKYEGRNVAVNVATSSVGTVSIVPYPTASPAYSRIDIAMPAHADLTENLPLELSFSGVGVPTQRATLAYDVVRNPCGVLISLNQVVTRRADALRIMRRIGEYLATLNTPPTALTPEEVAGIIASTARVELQDKLRVAASELGGLRPSLILDQDRLIRAETALVLAHMYEAVCKDPRAGTDDDSAQARAWREQFAVAWAEMGALALDVDGDGQTDADLVAPTAQLIITKRI